MSPGILFPSATSVGTSSPISHVIHVVSERDLISAFARHSKPSELERQTGQAGPPGLAPGKFTLRVTKAPKRVIYTIHILRCTVHNKKQAHRRNDCIPLNKAAAVSRFPSRKAASCTVKMLQIFTFRGAELFEMLSSSASASITDPHFLCVTCA